MTMKNTYKKTKTKTQPNTKCFQDPMYAIFFKGRGFKDLKYYIGCLLVMTKTKCFQDPRQFFSKAGGPRI